MTPGSYKTSGSGTGEALLVLKDSTFDAVVYSGCAGDWRHEVGTWKYVVFSPAQRYLRFSNVTDTIFHIYCGQTTYVQSVDTVKADSLQVAYSTRNSITLYDQLSYEGSYGGYIVGALYFWSMEDNETLTYNRQ